MPVSKRRNGSWLLSFYRDDGSRFRKTLPAQLTRRECETLEARYRLEERAKPAVERRGATVRDLFARYWSDHGQHLASHASERAYLDAWANRLGDETHVARITADQISAAAAHWRSTPEIPTRRKLPIMVTASTINHRLLCLQRIWRRASDLWGWDLARVPWGRLKLDEPQPVDRSTDEAALARYLSALPARSLYLNLFALHSGLRRGALLRLTRSDLDFHRGIIRAVSKGRAGGKPTPIPITEALLAVLQAMGQLPEVGCIFRVTKDELRKDRERARKVAGLADLRLHDLRHQFAQRLEDAGYGELITDALHHSDPKLRRRYAHVRLARLGEGLNKAQRK